MRIITRKCATAVTKPAEETVVQLYPTRQAMLAAQDAILDDILGVDADLACRIERLGICLGGELRVVLVQIRSPNPVSTGRNHLQKMASSFEANFCEAAIDAVVTVRDDSVAILAQADVDLIRGMCELACVGFRKSVVGIGRNAGSVAGIRKSYEDADLVLRVSARNEKARAEALNVTSYEDLSHTQRFIADGGLVNMVAWAEAFLSPVRGRAQLIEALVSYVVHHQNISATARSLFIHQNSLRYRLAKAESILHVSLKDPADISAVCLAFTALQIDGRVAWGWQRDGAATGPAVTACGHLDGHLAAGPV